MNQVQLRDVVVGFEADPVLRGVTLDVPHGALVAIVGPSGCGKTTLLRTIAGLVRARSGEIRLGGLVVAADGTHVAPEQRGIGWVPQDAALFPHLSVAENVAFGLGADRGTGRAAGRRAARGERVRHLLDLVSLAPLADRTPAQLSGGQAQRVALARALASDPGVVLLDEPFGALDPMLRAELRAEVRALLTAQGVTGILVTHDQAEALSIADYVAVMNAGAFLQVGRPEQVYRRPATPWVAGFVGEAVFLPGVWQGGTVQCALGGLPAEWVGEGAAALGDEVPAADGLPVTVLVRPEEIVVADASGEGLPARVSAVSYTGHDAVLGITLSDGTALRARVTAAALRQVGDDVALSVRGRVLAYPAGGPGDGAGRSQVPPPIE